MKNDNNYTSNIKLNTAFRIIQQSIYIKLYTTLYAKIKSQRLLFYNKTSGHKSGIS